MFKALIGLIKFLFTDLPEGADKESQLEDIEALAGEILAMDSNQIRSDRDQLSQLMDMLHEEVELIRLNNQPGANLPGVRSLWFEGAAVAELSQKLTHHLAALGFRDEEEQAAKYWATTALAVNGHYHHLVGPAMIYNAKIHHRAGDLNSMEQYCQAVLLDFETVLERAEKFDHKPIDEALIALQSMRQAAQMIIEKKDHPKARASIERIDALMALPED